MRIAVRGWSRDQGEREIVNVSLGSAKTELSDNAYSRTETYLFADPPNRRPVKVRIATHTELRLGGDYLLQVELYRHEIAQLFYATHSAEIVRMFKCFVEEEERQDAHERLKRWNQDRETVWQSLGEEGTSESK